MGKQVQADKGGERVDDDVEGQGYKWHPRLDADGLEGRPEDTRGQALKEHEEPANAEGLEGPTEDTEGHMGNIYDPIGSLRLAHVESELLQAEARRQLTEREQASDGLLSKLQREALELRAKLESSLPRSNDPAVTPASKPATP